MKFLDFIKIIEDMQIQLIVIKCKEKESQMSQYVHHLKRIKKWEYKKILMEKLI